MKKLHGSIAYHPGMSFENMIISAKEHLQPVAIHNEFWQELLESYLTEKFGTIDKKLLFETFNYDVEIWLSNYEVAHYNLAKKGIDELITTIVMGVNSSDLNIYQLLEILFGTHKDKVLSVYHSIFKSELLKSLRKL